ncbi:MAG: hypothetical protein JSV70_05075 [bacterium]|nr:MAG: hypothetical protein JSV70_05075 [bacterium]
MADSKTFISHRLLAAFVAVLLVVSFIPTSDGPAIEVLLSGAGFGKINAAAHERLEAQRDQALKGFLLLSALKVGLAVLRSSEVGLILNVRIGDLAVAVYDYVDLGWKVLLAAVAYYYMAGYLLDLASTVNIGFLWAALVSVAAWLLVVNLRPKSQRLRSALARAGTAASVLALLLYLGLPLSFIGAGWVSAHITGESILEANRLYEDMGENMPSLVDDKTAGSAGPDSTQIGTSSVTVPFPYDGTDPLQAFTEPPGGVSGRPGFLAGLVSGEKLRELRDYLKERSRILASAVLRQTAAYLFNIVLFPILMVVALYYGCRYLIGLAWMR